VSAAADGAWGRSPPKTWRTDRPESNKTRPGNSSVRTKTASRGSPQLFADTVPKAARLRAAARDEAVGVVAEVLPELVWAAVDPLSLPTLEEKLDDPSGNELASLDPKGEDDDEEDDEEPPPAVVVLGVGPVAAVVVQAGAEAPTLAMSAVAWA
jgi:hypothetical protein